MSTKTEVMATRKIFRSFVLFCVFCITQVVSQECTSPLGMVDRRINDSQITTSSFIKTTYGWQARLRQNIPPWGAWCPDVSGWSKTERNYDQYIQIDLLKLTKITGIATQGRQYNGGAEYVKVYKISYSQDSLNWIFYREKDQASNETKILRGNSNARDVVRHNLDPTIMARYIRVHPGYDPFTVCMRLELYGCVVEEVVVILSYSMPVGQKTKNGKVNYKDTTYNGEVTSGFYKDGTGILTDGKFGPVEAKSLKGKGWVGWNSINSQHINIIFEFSGVRKFKDVTLTVNVDKKRSVAVFNRSQIFFASTKDGFSDTSFLQYCPRNFQAQDNPYNADVTLSLCENTARFIKLRLYFGGKWLLITEISFNSVHTSESVKTSLQDCSGDTCIVTQSSTTSSPIIPSLTVPAKPTCTDCTTPKGRSTNSTGVFVGVAVTLAIVLMVVIVVVVVYKRRRQASKLSTSVLAVEIVEMQNQSPAEPSQDNQDEDYETPIDGGTTTNEEVEISPSSVYTALDMNQQNERGATNDSTYQKLLKRDSGYEYPTAEAATAPYEYTQDSPPSVYTEPDKNQQGNTASDHAHRKPLQYDSDYVIPAEGHRQTELYEEVGKEKTPPGYTELDKSQQDDTANDHAYQKLLQYDSDYVIPAEGHRQTEPYEEVGKEKTPPGYTELDATKRQEDNAGYQKLIRE